MDVPIWLITVAILLLFILALRGSINFKFGQWSLSTARAKVCAIPTSHIYQFRNLKSAIKFDVTRTAEKFESRYRGKFLEAQLLEEVPQSNRKIESLEYKSLLIEALDTIFTPKVKTIIYANHFPKQREGESIDDFRSRFKEKFTKKKFIFLLTTTGDFVRDNWEIASIDRTTYEDKYLSDQELLDYIFEELNELFLSCQERKTRIFNEMSQHENGLTVSILEDEWDLIYG